MGDPKRQRKKFHGPSHPWQKERIDAEIALMKEYGLRRKYEIWKMNSLLKSFLNRTKSIIGSRTSQSDIEKTQLIARLNKLGLLKKEQALEDVLNLTLKDIMERRLQTLILRKSLAKTMTQARQFITHEHIAVNNKKITTPSYLVTLEEEANIKLALTIKEPEKKPKQEGKEQKTKEKGLKPKDKKKEKK
jgi:small subunit ribosomal protein S4